MKLSAIRGAITVEENKIEAIRDASVRLFNQIILENRLKKDRIICVIAGSSTDITAYYPATALRLNGCDAPLFSSVEPQIEGSMPLCIRLMVLAKCKKPKHVYLEKAAGLKDNSFQNLDNN